MNKNIDAGQKNTNRISFKRILSSELMTTVMILIVIFLLISILSPYFLTKSNLIAVFRGMSFYVIAGIGMTLTLLVGEIDISIGSVAGMGAIMVTWLASRIGLPPVFAIIVTLVACSVVGLVNGVLVVKFKLPPFVATIAALYYARAIAMIITQGYVIYPISDIFIKIGEAAPLGLSWAGIVAIVLVVIFEFILRKTSYGRAILATGDNKEVAKLAGINIERTKISCFTLCSTLAAISGMMVAMQLESGQPTIGTGWELQVIAACAIGGISLLGGSGSMVGLFLGVCIMNILNNALVLLQVNTHYQDLVIGVVMVIAVLFDIYRRMKKLRA